MIYLLGGLPASGKTRLCTHKNNTKPYISMDEFAVNRYHTNDPKSLYAMFSVEKNKFYNDFAKAIIDKYTDTDVFLVEGKFFTKKLREEMLKALNKISDLPIGIIYISGIPLSHLIESNKIRKSDITCTTEDIVSAMASEEIPARDEEGFADVVYIQPQEFYNVSRDNVS